MPLIFMNHEVILIADLLLCHNLFYVYFQLFTVSNCSCSILFWQEDYRRTVTEIDEKEYISLKIIVSELRNQYVCHDLGCLHLRCNPLMYYSMQCFPLPVPKVTLHDMILKNIEKIKRPRSSNADALYWCSFSHSSLHLPSSCPPSSPCYHSLTSWAGLHLDVVHSHQYNQQ